MSSRKSSMSFLVGVLPLGGVMFDGVFFGGINGVLELSELFDIKYYIKTRVLAIS